MRIGINTLFMIPGEVGGSETYLCETLRALLAQDGDEYVLFTNRENHDICRKRFGDCPRLRCDPLNFRAGNRYARIVREQTQLPAHVFRAGVDVLWSPGYTAPLFARCPQVLSVLDMQYKSHPDDMTPLARLVTHALVYVGVQRVEQLLTLSDFSCREIVRHAKTTAAKITVTHLAADETFRNEILADRKTAILEQMGIDRAPYLLCIANTYPHKNVAALVQAFAMLESEISHDLVLVGKPRLGEPAVQAALHRLKNPARVHRIANVKRDSLAALYQAADLFAFPSRYEGFGLPVLEAMESGTPVLTTRCGSIPEVGGDTVEYVDDPTAEAFASRLRVLLKRPKAEWKTQIARAKERAGDFSWNTTAMLTRQAFSAALHARTPQCPVVR